MSLRERFRPGDSAPKIDEAKAARALSAARGRASRPPPPPAAKALAAAVKPLLRETGLGLSELKRRWADIAGESFARAAPEKLAAGVLTLRAPGALAPFLQQQAPLLLERLRVAGAKVKTIKIEQRTVTAARAPNVTPLRRELTTDEEAALAMALTPVSDEGLKAALLRLGRAVKRA
jgi:hypothetical protein